MSGSTERKYDAKLIKTPPSLAAVFSEHRQEVLSFVRARIGQGPPDPEDIVQQAFANYAASDQRASIRNPVAFLVRSATNLITDHRRRSATRFNTSANGEEFDHLTQHRDDISPEVVLIGKERLAMVLQVLKRIPRRQRRFLLLNRIEGLSYAEISRQTGVSQATVRREVEAGVDACRERVAKAMRGTA